MRLFTHFKGDRSLRLLLAIPIGFTLVVAWLAWSALHAAPPVAAGNLRGAGLSVSAAIEQLALADPSFRSLSRFGTPDVAYFALVDGTGTIRFHTNPTLVGTSLPPTELAAFPDRFSERRERLGTGEEVYLLRTRIHAGRDTYLLVLALHTYRADQVIRRARTGVTIVAALTAAVWLLTVVVFVLLRREERRRTETSRREELARLGEMGAIMAHEMRNPLAGIKGFAQLIETAADLEQARRHAEKIVSQALRMEELAGDLLAFARDDRDPRTAADLTAVVQDCVALAGMEPGAEKVKIELHVPPQAHAFVAVERIVQLVLNLLKNALQAMPGGGVLAVGLTREKGSIILTIKDSGCGIAPEHLEQIFEPFWTSRAQGTGLGLALCRKVSEEHGGRLSVNSTVGIGTEFTLTLPAIP